MSPTQSESRNLIPWVLGGVAVLAILAVVIVGVGGGDDGPDPTAPVDVAGSPLPPFAEGADGSVGLPIPEVFGVDFDEADVEIKADGTPKAIVFLAHWCPHCQQEVADMTSFLDDGGTFPEGVDIVSVSTSVDLTRGNPPEAWLADAGWPYPVVRDDGNNTVAGAYGMAGTPFWVFADGDGNVVKRASGAQGIPEIISTMEGLVVTPTDAATDTADGSAETGAEAGVEAPAEAGAE